MKNAKEVGERLHGRKKEGKDARKGAEGWLSGLISKCVSNALHESGSASSMKYGYDPCHASV